MKKLSLNKNQAGNIFFIPLFLPNEGKTDLLHFGKFDFEPEAIYAYGRIIEENVLGGGKFVEIFNYIGPFPENKDMALSTGLMFPPVHVVAAFEKKRWRSLFEDPFYNKYKDSDYAHIKFLLPSALWEGGNKTEVTPQKHDALLAQGIQPWVIYLGSQLEDRIRDVLSERGQPLNYVGMLKKYQDRFPKTKEKDCVLKKKIAPFQWRELSPNAFTFTLEAGGYQQPLFLSCGLSGNGHDWAAVARQYLNRYLPEFADTLALDPEADLFSASSSDKKSLKQFAIGFKKFCEDDEKLRDLLQALGK